MLGEPSRVHRRDYWERAVAEVKGGERVAAVAKRRGLAPKTLSWWCWKLGQEKRGTQFLPVVVTESERSETPIEIVIGDLTLRVISGTDAEYVATLALALRRQC